jgi:hypothetical protein
MLRGFWCSFLIRNKMQQESNEQEQVNKLKKIYIQVNTKKNNNKILQDPINRTRKQT